MTENHRTADPTGILEGHSRHTSNYTPDQQERDLVSALKERFEEADYSRRNWDHDVNFFKVYLKGNQLYLRSISTGTTFRASHIPDSVHRLTSSDNILRTASRALVGKLSRIIPSWAVIPRTNDQADLRASVVADSFLDYVFRKQNLRKKYVRGCKQLMWSGIAYYELVWNKDLGRKLSWCKECNYTDEPELDGQPCPQCAMTEQQAQVGGAPTQFQPQGFMQVVREGDLEVLLHDPRDVYPEPGISDVDQMRWFCVRKPFPVSELRKRFPKHAEYIHTENGIMSDRVSGMHDGDTETRTAVQYLDDHAYLYRFVQQPSALHEKGRVICMIHDMIVEEKDNPCHMLERLPLFTFRWEWDEGDFLGESPIAQSWHLLKERNKLLTQLRTQRELTNHPQKLVPITSRISLAEWDDKPGRHLVFNPMGGKPAYLSPPEFPSYVYNEAERLRVALQDKFSVTDHEMGRSASDQSGRYAAILEAQSSESITPIIVENNSEWLEMGKAILMLAQERYTEDRVWTVQGQDRVLSYAWSEMELAEGWDLIIAEEDSLSKNPALRLNQAIELLQAGVFTDMATGKPDMRTFKRAAGLRVPGISPDISEGERAYAAQVPKRIENGEGFEPAPWDDVEVMTEELLAWLRGPGRTAEPGLRNMVGKIWMAYAQMNSITGLDRKLMPSGMPPPRGGGAKGGIGAGQLPGDGQRPAGGTNQPVGGEARDVSRSADQMAENQARVTQGQEN